MLPFLAVITPVIILFCGIAVDVSMLELKRVQMQSACDAAAIGGELEAERGTGNWISMGKQEAASNGFTDGANNVTVTVAQYASYGEYYGRYDGLQATISQNVKTVFLGALNGGMVTVTTRSVALMTPCMYFTGTGALQNHSLELYTGDIDGDSCPINVNTNMEVQGYANTAVEAYNVTGSAGSSSLAGSTYPYPNFNAPAFSDPLTAVTSPSFSSCTVSNTSLSGAVTTLNPGTYCKGLNFTNSIVTLNPGLYIITGGAAWSGSTVTGTGVTLFFTSGGGGSYGQFKVTNGSSLYLSAPTESSNGSVPAILVFADRNWVATGGQDFQVISSTFYGDGIWYLSKAGIETWSCGVFTGPNYLGMVADNIFTAGTNLQPRNNYSSVTSGNPFRRKAPLVQ